jgi:hypothetical protein
MIWALATGRAVGMGGVGVFPVLRWLCEASQFRQEPRRSPLGAQRKWQAQGRRHYAEAQRNSVPAVFRSEGQAQPWIKSRIAKEPSSTRTKRPLRIALKIKERKRRVEMAQGLAKIAQATAAFSHLAVDRGAALFHGDERGPTAVLVHALDYRDAAALFVVADGP